MDKTISLKITIFMTFLALVPKAKCQFLRPPQPPRPLCASQLALANHACDSVPYTPVPPPSPLTPPPSPIPPPPGPTPPNGEGHRHGHGHVSHRHRHGHKNNTHATPVEENCCRWLKQVDTECVCNLLVGLQPFLARPSHAYTVAVGEACMVTYQCPGRLRA